MADRDDYIISAAARCLQILRLFDSEHREMTQTEIAARAGLTKSSCFRALVTLESEGFVEYIEKTKCYRLGTAILRLAYNSYVFSDLKDIAREYLQALADEFGVFAQLGVINGSEVVIIDREVPKFSSDHFFMLVAPMGKGIPLHCTGLGKVLMAYAPDDVRESCLRSCRFERYQARTITDRAQYERVLEQIRREGYCITDREHEADIVCMTFPIYDHQGRIAAAFSGTGRVEKMKPEVHERMRSRMAQISEAISRRLGSE